MGLYLVGQVDYVVRQVGLVRQVGPPRLKVGFWSWTGWASCDLVGSRVQPVQLVQPHNQ